MDRNRSVLDDWPMESFRVQPSTHHSDYLQRIVSDRGSYTEIEQKLKGSYRFECFLFGLGHTFTLCCSLEAINKRKKANMIVYSWCFYKVSQR